jgi:hypothetical protein
MESTIKPDESTRQLLEEGARSYLKATAAIMAFEQEVQRRCRQVLERHFVEYAAAIGIQPRLKTKEIKDLVYPDDDPERRSVGVQIARKRIRPDIDYLKTKCVLDWKSGTGLHCYVGERIRPETLANNLRMKFRDLDPTVCGEVKEYGLMSELNADQASTFQERLETLLVQWIELWKQIGGLEAGLKA